MAPRSALPPDQLGPRLMEVFRVVGPLYRLAAQRVADDEAIDGLSTGVRAVLEHVRVDGPATVPAIARALATSRQWVQRMTNEAIERGLVELGGNPAHRRSPLVRLTPAGRRAIDRVMRREARIMARTSGDLTEADVTTCIRVLDAMAAVLAADRSDARRPDVSP